MTAPFPHHYDVGLRWNGARQGTLSAPPRPGLVAGPPPQFDGQEDWWSPEHLLLASVNLCLMTTFLALADRAKVRILAYDCRASGTLDKMPQGLVFTEITLKPVLRAGPGDQERAEALLQTAKKYCIVSNSLKTPVSLAPASAAA